MAAAASQWRAKNISHKLRFLEEQRGLLLSAVDGYVGKVVGLGTSWIEGRQEMEYGELCHVIDQAVELICHKCEEIVDDGEHAGLSEASYTPSPPASSSVSSSTGPTAAASAQRQQQVVVPVRTADDSSVQQLLARMCVMEEAISSLRASTDRVSEKLASTDQQVTNQVQEMAKVQKKQQIKVNNFQEQITGLTDRFAEMEEDSKTRHKSLDKQVQKLLVKQENVSAEHAVSKVMMEQMSRDMESVKADVESMQSSVEGVESRLCSDSRKVEEKVAAMEERVSADSKTVEELCLSQEMIMASVRGLDARLLVVEGGGGSGFRRMEEKLQEADKSYKVLCQLLTSRLKPLEELRQALNKQAQSRAENVKKLQEVIQTVNLMSPRIQELESHPVESSFGFSAMTFLNQQDVDGSVIHPYVKVSGDEGTFFNKNSGIFTAPRAGLYVACVSASLAGSGALQAAVRHGQQGSKVGQTVGVSVCECVVEAPGSTVCGVGVVKMVAGDVLFSVVYQNSAPECEKVVRFSCFTLG